MAETDSDGVRSFGVIGAGSWGTALALVAARASLPVVLWVRTADAAARLARERENATHLPGIALPANITPTAEAAALATCDTLLVATPAQAMRGVITALAPHLAPHARTVIAAKGIEQASGRFLVDVLQEIAPDLEPLVLSGPSFASDVARGLPTAVTLAGRTLDAARPVAEALSQSSFRPYVSDDLVGVQVGGAIKNVLAIACGIVDGRGLGESARAALIARAFAELTRLGRALGARPETLAGLSGLGDLVLTCSSLQSRNFRFGRALGEGRSLTEASAGAKGISEGAFTTAAAVVLAARHGIEMPIAQAVHDIIEGHASVDETIAQLMQRPLKAEH